MEKQGNCLNSIYYHPLIIISIQRPQTRKTQPGVQIHVCHNSFYTHETHYFLYLR